MVLFFLTYLYVSILLGGFLLVEFVSLLVYYIFIGELFVNLCYLKIIMTLLEM